MALKIGMIGAGGVARVHALEYDENKETELIAIADIDDKAKEEFVRTFSVKKVVSDYREILKDTSIDVIDICLPHFLHKEVTVAALKAGKDMILEKPIASTLDDADEMIETAAREGRQFFVALNQRFLPAHQKLKEMLERGDCGKPFLALGIIIGDELARMNRRDNWKGSWDKAGGGALIDTGMHIIDLMHYFFGIPKTVNCGFGRFVVEHENKGDDNVVVILEYDDMIANIVVTYSAISDNWSEKKDIYLTNASLHVISEAEKPLYKIENKGEPRYIDVPHDTNWWVYSVRRGIAHFIDCVINNREPLVKPEDARMALHTILRAYKAARADSFHAMERM